MTQISEENLEVEENDKKEMFLTFFIGGQEYGIEIEYVIEIIGMQVITEVPELPEYVRGIINLRGKIIPVIDVRLRFKKQYREYNDRTCIIVVNIKDISVGLLVDAVEEVLTITEQDIVPPPKINKGYYHKYIKGIGNVGDNVKLLLDCDKLLNDDEIENFSNIE